jgi:hypothetical protein
MQATTATNAGVHVFVVCHGDIVAEIGSHDEEPAEAILQEVGSDGAGTPGLAAERR